MLLSYTLHAETAVTEDVELCYISEVTKPYYMRSFILKQL